MNQINLSDILELPVAERIRLVELIWDSVAAVPEQVPVSDELKAELERRLAEFEANPEAGSPWARSARTSSQREMAIRLAISDRAVREIGVAFEWYETQLRGLGIEFLEALDAQFELVARSPQLYAQTLGGIRRALLARFPYAVFYTHKADIVSVLGVIHTSRSPRRWPRRP